MHIFLTEQVMKLLFSILSFFLGMEWGGLLASG